ncbi:Glu/Leu/Phe/Val dehydrogenase dimerization domain-containing protein [Echinicola jeungdonensis]|uniref:Glu/Leu/Phe/Val dehydrogenase dimerization domain-containing protein n=1 Tax=Echinicola jeungdonensis TaxID=709343 RepID=A0ABV5J3E4_9BACT|nr:Glu/Leu/Phe/Val dehydrogenase dimerization domain-containing protein [Echinicola jeungdonensis]MDN3668987.1 Glu/Leu/Phe/Val dehydrogenase dimerization domain-containing protein [Echinicola jeungdonensis]
MNELLKKFENKQPEIVFEWKDSESEAEGWVVINSLRGGAAGGGTRMRKGLDRREVESLAKTMEVKFTISGPPIGGAKSGINFDPNDPRKKAVLKRWYKAVLPLLKYYYGTGGDFNVDEIHEVIPITESYGLWHPQEGIVNGHFHATEPQKIRKIGQLRQGVRKVLEDPLFTPVGSQKFTVADMITGYGVAESVRHYYQFWGGRLKGKKAIIQGWGNVGASAAFYLALKGVKIVGIIDRNGGLTKASGFNFEEIKPLFIHSKGHQLFSDHLVPFEEINERIWDMEHDIFIPAAASRLINHAQMERLIKAGLEVVSCGANIPFADPEIFYGPTTQFVDERVALIPDFIANCGMARVFTYLMSNQAAHTDRAIFNDVSNTIRKALKNTHQRNSGPTKIARSSFEIALELLT